jgi:ribosome biogenesis GTPase
MNKKTEDFSKLPYHEKQKFLKKASAFARAQKTSRSHDEEASFERIRKRQKSRIMPQLLAESEAAEKPNATLITSLGGGWALVFLDGQEVKCRVPFSIVERAAPGDAVFVADGHVRSLAPRRTWLSRPDPHIAARERVIACNIDLFVIVSSWKNPAPRFGLIDRYLISIQKGGAEAMICFNKSDLCRKEEMAEHQSRLAFYQEIGVGVLNTSAETKLGIDALIEKTRGKRIAFVGHSGVGKTSLRNAIDGSHIERTGAVREKGRHTTTSTSLTRLEDGTEIFDTPGIRELGLYQIKPEELVHYFPEFGDYLGRCRFSNCAHRGDPDCAIVFAVQHKEISRDRYESFLRLLG